MKKRKKTKRVVAPGTEPVIVAQTKLFIQTRKLKLVIDPERSAFSIKDIHDYFKKVNQQIVMGANKMMTDYYTRYRELEALSFEDKKAKDLISPETNEAYFGKQLMRHEKLVYGSYQAAKEYFFLEGASYATLGLGRMVAQKFLNEIGDVVNGSRSLSTFNQGLPISLSLTPQLSCKFAESGGTNFEFSKDISFKIFYGRDSSNNKKLIKDIIDGTLKLSGSKIQYKDREFTLHLAYGTPACTKVLDKNIRVGIDLGINTTAMMVSNVNDYYYEFDFKNEFFSIRNGIQRRRRTMQKELKYVEGGKGRIHKLKALERFREKEHNACESFNHKISRSMIDNTLQLNAGVIVMEELTGIATNNLFLKRWSYYQLQKMIEYKAIANGIEVWYVDPAYTSQTCSQCGNCDKEQRQQKLFECLVCGHKEDADVNGARNIVKWDKIIRKVNVYVEPKAENEKKVKKVKKINEQPVEMAMAA